MVYKKRQILRDIDGNPVPQEFNPIAEQFEVKRAVMYRNSSETKPVLNMEKGDIIYEIDTQILYMFNGSIWVVQ